ncbi:homeobox protein 2-like [Chironomus tepperi]|uniref:homeobox protein 2-like n=1 Tax=Chironomus tepperi TaxID=113505 RepID=UPI00391FA54E
MFIEFRSLIIKFNRTKYSTMLLKFVILVNFLSYATCRTARQFREIPEAAARLSNAEFPYYNIMAPDGPGTYAFGYEIEDPASGNVQFRDEQKHKNGSVTGSYGVLLSNNVLHITRYIADHRGYRASSETKKKNPNTPLRIELQLQPTTSSTSAQGENQEYPFSQSTTTPIPSPFETMKPSIDPVVASQIYQQHQINVNPSQNNLRDPNIIDPNVANAFLNQMFFVPQNSIYGLRQNPYDNTVSTYSAPQNSFPFFNWFGFGNSNSNNNNNNNLYADQVQQQPQRPVIDFLNGIANNNPITNFFNSFGQSQNDQNSNYQNQNPFQQFLNNINPFNFFNNNNNNNNNNRPVVSLPITQSDYIPPAGTQQGIYMPPQNNVDSSVFSNDHFLNPNTMTQGSPQVVHNYQPTSSSFNDYYRPQYKPYSSAWPYNNNNRPHIQTNNYASPYTYYNPYQSMTSNNHNKKPSTKKRKKNKNKVQIDTDSDWFEDFLDKRKEASVEITSKHASKKQDDDYDLDLDEYFR